MAHNEPPHQGLRCLQIQLFSSLVLKELKPCPEVFLQVLLLRVVVKVFLKVEVGWLVGCCGLNGPLRQYFSLYRAVSQREGERKEK